jgi:uncharacterized protein (DUF1501 family)
MTLTRREFLKGTCATAAAGAVGGPALLFADSAIAAPNGHDTVVHLFLRGGLDGLNLVVPIDGADRGFYEQARPNLAIAATGAYGALPLTLASGAGTGFGLHPSASGLRDLWNAGHLGIVHACGLLTSVTRSHFDAQLYIDLGTPGQQGIGSGWLARAMNTQPNLNGAEKLPALGVGARQPVGLLASVQALTMASPSDFALNAGAWSWQTVRAGAPTGFAGVNETLAALWNGSTALELGGQRADRALKVIAQQTYSAPPTGWPTGAFAQQMWTIAQSIQFNLGLHYATLDLGGWDTHDGQGTAGSGYHYYQNKIAELSQALSAFYAALDASGHAGRVTVVVQSEFGRRVRANANGGTDHGYGNPVLVLGGAVNGRRFYGSWSGLDPEILSPHFGDVPVTTDHRRVLSEILVKRMGNANLSTVFPGYSGYAPLGIVRDFGAVAKPMPGISTELRARSAMAAQPRVENPDLLERLMRYMRELVD